MRRMTLKTKLVGFIGVALVAVSTVACGPGLSHRVKQPTDVSLEAQVEVELARAIGVTTLSSETLAPAARVENEAAEAAPAPAPRTWGAPDAQNAQGADELPATRN
jgi:hypothetical protein